MAVEGCGYARVNAPLQPAAPPASGPNKCPVQQPGKEHQPDDICVLMSILDQAILIHQKRILKGEKKKPH